MNACDTCLYYIYDDESQSYYCDVNLDEDELARLYSRHNKECPYYTDGNEYKTVRHQI